MWSHGTGADVMKRIAAPMVGGVATSALVVLLVYPVIYFIWKGWHLPKAPAAPAEDGAVMGPEAESGAAHEGA
jgi:Cu(I)/Ag(I) efflux system membrane protein CusA/SilA